MKKELLNALFEYGNFNEWFRDLYALAKSFDICLLSTYNWKSEFKNRKSPTSIVIELVNPKEDDIDFLFGDNLEDFPEDFYECLILAGIKDLP